MAMMATTILLLDPLTVIMPKPNSFKKLKEEWENILTRIRKQCIHLRIDFEEFEYKPGLVKNSCFQAIF